MLNTDQLDSLIQKDMASAIEQTISQLRADQNAHQLFDALLLKWKHAKGLPLTHPSSQTSVPDEFREEFEGEYLSAARQAGEMLIARNQYSDAFIYLNAIRDTKPLAEALDQYQASENIDELEEMIHLALIQKINPRRGVDLMLETYGLCNTITMMDQQFLELSPEDRTICAGQVAQHLHEELKTNLSYDLEQRGHKVTPEMPLSELIDIEPAVFENDNYHVDISHLHAAIRFARSLESDSKELPLVMELTKYGARLSGKLHYSSQPPFDDYFTAHQHYFEIVANDHRENALTFFLERLDQAEQNEEQQLIAYVLVDLYMRCDRPQDAVRIAEQHLQQAGEQSGFSFIDLCTDTKDMPALKRHASQIEDPVLYLAASWGEAHPTD